MGLFMGAIGYSFFISLLISILQTAYVGIIITEQNYFFNTNDLFLTQTLKWFKKKDIERFQTVVIFGILKNRSSCVIISQI